MSIVTLLLLAQVASSPEPAAPPSGGPELTGDFDHDGLNDRAYFLSSPGKVELMMQPGRTGAGAVLVSPIRDYQHTSMWVAKPGSVETACGKGLGDDAALCDRRSVELKGDTIAFGSQESAQAVAIWNGEGFDTVWISD